jgi:hypothetical protein
MLVEVGYLADPQELRVFGNHRFLLPFVFFVFFVVQSLPWLLAVIRE